jgi:hypothetical protein
MLVLTAVAAWLAGAPDGFVVFVVVLGGGWLLVWVDTAPRP